ncbi:MAG: class IV adenylate cyclase [Candidatus Diapherotrites archaeon]|nr:class IV adenylate cyclase [Candidatus Diapherotrites archaeon]
MEVEFKAKAPRGIEKKLAAAGAKGLGTVVNKDTYYDRPGEPLRRKGAVVRVRSQGKKTIVTYKSPSKSRSTKAMREIEIRATPAIEVLLRGLGYKVTLEKEVRRTSYSLNGVTVCLDTVKGLGSWVEFEVFGTAAGARKKILAVASKLGIPAKELTPKSYPQLIREKLKSKKKQK